MRMLSYFAIFAGLLSILIVPIRILFEGPSHTLSGGFFLGLLGVGFGVVSGMVRGDDGKTMYDDFLDLCVWFSRGGVFHDLRQKIAKDVQRQREADDAAVFEAAEVEKRTERSRRGGG